MKNIKIMAGIIILLCACNTHNCYIDINNIPFKPVSNFIPNNAYFVIKQDKCYDMASNDTFAESKIIWTSCENYKLICLKIRENKHIKVNDTTFVKIVSFLNDTLVCENTFHNYTAINKSVVLK